MKVCIYFKSTFLYLISTLFLRKEFVPEGWHVPSDAEWTTLEDHLIANGYNYDGTSTGNKIGKSMASTTGWEGSTETGFKEFESAQRTLSGIEVVSIIKKDQIINPCSTSFKTFCSLVA